MMIFGNIVYNEFATINSGYKDIILIMCTFEYDLPIYVSKHYQGGCLKCYKIYNLPNSKLLINTTILIQI